MPADQELISGATLQLQDVEPFGSGGRVLIGAGGFDPAAGVGQRVSELDTQRSPRLARGRPELEGLSVELGRAVEGQGLGRLGGSLCVILPGHLGFPGRFEMDRQSLGVRASGVLEHPCQFAVPRFQNFRRQMLDHRLPDAIVVNLDVIERTRARAAHQMACAQHCQRGRPLRAKACHAADGGLAHGLAGNRDDLQEASRSARQPPDPLPQHFVEIDLPRRRTGGQLGAHRDVSHQLGDEKWITTRLPSYCSGVDLHVRIGSAEQTQCKLACF